MPNKDREAQRAYDKAWHIANLETSREYSRAKRRLRTAMLHAIKLDSGCVDCGYNEDAKKLDFDHLPQYVKCFNIMRGKQGAWASILEEIAKCEVVCKKCHRKRTAARHCLSLVG